MALVTIEELAPRLPFVMDANEEREARGALEDLSFDAQSLGSPAWVPEALPQSVRNLVLRAAARHMKNYEGYTVSRAGDESVQWSDGGESAGTATFTEDEKKMLRVMGGRTPFIGGVGVVAWGKADRPTYPDGLVPAAQGKGLPMFADGQEPW